MNALATTRTEPIRVPIEGELTCYSAGDVRLRILDALDQGREVEVDLAQVGDIDSAGIQLMVAARREAGTRAASLRFVGHSDAVRGILELCELSDQFDEVDRPGDAARSDHES